MPDIPDNTFAAACYEQNSYAELVAALKGPADADDCKAWGLTPAQWREQIELALSHKRPPGRPIGSGEGRTARAEWRTTPDTKAAAEALAEADGSLSAMLDRLVQAEQKRRARR